MPDFMVFLDWKEFPWQWWNSDQFWWCALLVVLVPGVLAFVFGFFAFRSRIKGVYFSIITQAMTFAFMLLFFRERLGMSSGKLVLLSAFVPLGGAIGSVVAGSGVSWE